MDQERIYAEHAAEYDALVCAEDCDGHLLPALEAIAPLTGASVLEAGCEGALPLEARGRRGVTSEILPAEDAGP